MIFTELIDLIFEKLINLPVYIWILTIFIISFTDSVFSPIPPDPLLIFSTTYHPEYLFLFIFVCVFSSYLGGLVSYICADKIYQKYTSFIHKFINKNQFDKANKQFKIRGDLIILICAITFIPYKIIAWVTGFVKYSLTRFSIFSVLGRTLRYSIIGILSYIFGENIKNILEVSLEISNYLAIIVVLLLVLVLFYWNNKTKTKSKV
tara:strand:- start:1898 stop:2515 length:618 start_codon:yes stop_codon:yes gene_type:complete